MPTEPTDLNDQPNTGATRSIGEMEAALAHRLSEDGRLILGLMLRGWDRAAQLDHTFFADLVSRLPALRSEIIFDVVAWGARQMDFQLVVHRLTLFGAPEIRAECRARYPRLLERVRFLTNVLPQLAGFHAAQLTGRIHLERSGRRRGKRYLPLCTIETVLGKEIVEECYPPSDSNNFLLDSDPGNASVVFGKELNLVVTNCADLTQDQFVEKFQACGITQSWVSQAITGRRLPSGRYEAVIAAIALEYDRPQLLNAFRQARKAVANKSDRAVATRDHVPHIDYLAHLAELELARIEEELNRAHRDRTGQDLAPATVDNHRKTIADLIVAAVCPSSGESGERGVGIDPLELRAMDLIRTDVLEAALANAAERRGSTVGVLANADKLLAGMVEQLTRPHEGVFWKLAPWLQTRYPSPDLSLPSHWPESSGPDGSICRNTLDQVRAQCCLTHKIATSARANAEKAPGSALHLAKMWGLYSGGITGMPAIFVILNRALPTRTPIMEETISAAMVCSYLGGSMLSPLRISDATKIGFEQVRRRGDGSFAEFIDRSKKTRRFRTSNPTIIEFPRCLSRYLFPYHLWRQKQPHEGQYFIRPDGRPHTPASMNYILDKVLAIVARDFFPCGFDTHDPRYVVATEAFRAYGQKIGAKIASEALRNCEKVNVTSYCLISGIPDFVFPENEKGGRKPATLEQLIKDSVAAAAKFKDDYVVEDESRGRRSSFDKQHDERVHKGYRGS